MLDFTLKTYRYLLESFIRNNYLFTTISGKPIYNENYIVLRHDVDKKPINSLMFAKIEAQFGIRGTYYFRTVRKAFDERTISIISELGHEIGYHYEDMNLAAKSIINKSTAKKKEDLEKMLAELAIEGFQENLNKLRKISAVTTICMHGTPLSKWDSRLLWKFFNYRDYGIESEPYFDFKFENVLYLTDTGRRWDGQKVSIRDKAGFNACLFGRENDPFSKWQVKPKPGSLMNMTKSSYDFQKKYKIRSSNSLIQFAFEGKLPDKIMMTFHPQRWTDSHVLWLSELFYQNIKNQAKYILQITRN